MIKMIALDIDGTIANTELQIAPAVKRAVAQALERGLVVTLATGRGPSPTDYFAEQLALSAPLVCLQGGVIFDYRERRTLYERRLPPDTVPWIAAEAQARGWHLHFETTDMVYMPYGFETPEELAALFRVANLTRLKDFRQMPTVPHKFIISIQDPAIRETVTQELTQLVQAAGRPLDVFASHPLIVEGLPAGIHKASGLEWLGRRLGIAPDEVLAIGDNDNDLTMLRWAGVGVAMGNASPAALAAADWIAPSLAEDGAAAAIEKYALTA